MIGIIGTWNAPLCSPCCRALAARVPASDRAVLKPSRLRRVRPRVLAEGPWPNADRSAGRWVQEAQKWLRRLPSNPGITMVFTGRHQRGQAHHGCRRQKPGARDALELVLSLPVLVGDSPTSPMRPERASP